MPTDDKRQVAVIAGAGPAGLTAALELLRRSDILPLVFEADSQVGGISKTINFRGNRMDLGGHRFFSKSDWVMRWWQDILPIADDQMDPTNTVRLAYQGTSADFLPGTLAPSSSDNVMLVRQRISRIFYRRRFFDYPLKLNATTLRNMGLRETVHVGISYGRAKLAPTRPETNLENFLVNRFGDRLYRTFFKDYTEKVWGVPCSEISAEWGAQRIKGLSVTKALMHAAMTSIRSSGDTAQKHIETSLIERFLYPKFGPGQMWGEVAKQITQRGGEVRLNNKIIGLQQENSKVKAVQIMDEHTGSVNTVACDHFISTIPVRDLVAYLQPADAQVARIADRLPYRDFITVGLLLRRMNSPRGNSGRTSANGMPADNWIYIQEPDVKLGRLQIFNNWSPAMVADPETIWLGLEYFCNEGDDLWARQNDQMIDFAASELEKIGIINREDIIDATVARVPKAYPAYFGAYADFGKVRAYLDGFANIYPVGRNGMHRYNNQDHSMLAANYAVNTIINQGADKSEIWRVNLDGSYHEEIDGGAM